MTLAEIAEAFEKDKQAIARLYVRGYISEAAKKMAYKKLDKAIAKAEKVEK